MKLYEILCQISILDLSTKFKRDKFDYWMCLIETPYGLDICWIDDNSTKHVTKLMVCDIVAQDWRFYDER